MRKTRISHSKLLILAVSIFLISPNSAYAIDPSDLAKPTYTISQISPGSNDLNVIIFKVEVADEKNGVRLQDWRSGTEYIGRNAYEFWTLGASSSALAPACTLANNQIPVLIMDQNAPNKVLDFASKSNTYYLITFLDGIKFPDGCPTSEIKFTSSFSTLSVMDEAKNYATLVYPQREFVIPTKKSTGALCFGFDRNPLNGADSLLSRYTQLLTQMDQAKIKDPASQALLENIRSKLTTPFSTFASNTKVYSNFATSPFNLDAFLKLPLCKYTGDFGLLENSLFSANKEFQNLSASLRLEAEKAAAANKKSTITCIKGKVTKKVTAVSPKCPAGYKKK